ncbi:unnamed protein product [Notodromas monacha]|uniref:Protein Wnt n=1 Tax=Notodromas monacha TaxID=399045 RepID=A0A7R9BC65_9CRUS|nr:unnamed protein product [Notodromas monacha]CAG0912581.1 unnamed protein product [Notodromas monacha]
MINSKWEFTTASLIFCVVVFGQTSLSSATSEPPWWLHNSPRVFRHIAQDQQKAQGQNCKNRTLLNDRDKALCAMSQDIQKIVAAGAQVAFGECQHQFKMRRWNCTIPELDVQELLNSSILAINSREKAYLYSICSAGAAYAISRACAKGVLPLCSCDERIRRTSTNGLFEWGGCSEVLQGQMQLICKCHGVSGACTTKVCWKKMRNFRAVGNALFDKFEGATLVRYKMQKNRLRPTEKYIKKPTKRDLVYLQQSPDYCNYNKTYFFRSLGISGTSGRECNKTSLGTDGCEILCCGRGYKTLVREIQEKCDCNFSWDVTRVVCKWCIRMLEEYHCN